MWPSKMSHHQMMAVLALAFLALMGSPVKGQSNYNRQAISITYEEEEVGHLPVFGTLNGTVTELDTLPSTINLNKTRATLNCSSGYMGIKMEFDRPFYGIVYADYDRNSACKITGNGQKVEDIKLPLKGCGTVQSPARVFTNNIVVRFHPSFEIVGDEVITIICRYPPPIVQNAHPDPLVLPPAEEIRTLAPLREFEILLIICAIIFLALLLLGIGCSYYCLKRRNIKVVKRRPASTLGSEITKISEPISMFGGLKIPRAHAEDTSGSEEMTESVRSEFPSEIISTASEEEFTSAYSDGPFELPEGTVFAQLHAPPAPGFDVRTKITKGEGVFSDVESKASSESELVLRAQEQYLTTILEKTETNTLETLERVRRAEAKAGPPPVHARVRVVNKAQLSDNSELESESEYSQVSDYYQGKLRLATSDQTPFTIGLQDAETLHREREQREQREQREERQRIQERERRLVQELEQRQAMEMMEQRHETHMTSRRDHYKTEKEQVVGGVTASDLITPVIVERATASMRVSPARNNFDVLIRVLDEPNYNLDDGDDVSSIGSVLTDEERFRLREVIMTDEKIQTILKETHTTEKMLMLKDYREIGQVVSPQKWDVLIRVIDNAEAASQRRSGDERSSTSRTSYGGGQKTAASSLTAQEMRSMSEIMVDYGYSEQHHHMETRSGISGRSSTTTRAVSSTADRSGGEIVATDHFINREAYFSSEHEHHEHSERQ